MQFKIGGDRTGGTLAIKPHIHEHEDELTYVIEGTIFARVGDTEVAARAGPYVWKPRCVLHTFWNPTIRPARLLEIISPAGFERFFEELASLLGSGTGPEDRRLSALSDRYGLSFDHFWVDDIQQRFGPLRMV